MELEDSACVAKYDKSVIKEEKQVSWFTRGPCVFHMFDVCYLLDKYIYK